MLLAPNSPASIDNDLRGENAFEPTRHTFGRASSRFVANESKVTFARRNISQQFEHLYHRIVIVSNRVVIAALQRPDLRPTAVWVLSRENVVEPPIEGGAVAFGVLGSRR